MKKISTVPIFESEIFKEQRLTIGMDLGDRWSCYCILDEAGRILLEQKVATTPEAMKQIFVNSFIPASGLLVWLPCVLHRDRTGFRRCMAATPEEQVDCESTTPMENPSSRLPKT